MLSKYQNSLIDTIAMLNSKRKGSSKKECLLEDWRAALNFCDINFSSRQQELINLLIYK